MWLFVAQIVLLSGRERVCGNAIQQSRQPVGDLPVTQAMPEAYSTWFIWGSRSLSVLLSGYSYDYPSRHSGPRFSDSLNPISQSQTPGAI